MIRGVLLNSQSREGDWLLGDALGKVHRLSREGNDKPAHEPSSLMPGLGSLRLRHQDLLDLLAFFSQGSLDVAAAPIFGLVLQAETRSEATENWKWATSDKQGTITAPAESFEIRVPVFLPEKGEVTVSVWGGRLAKGQNGKISMPAGRGYVSLRLEQPFNGHQKQFALRLQGPQGLVVGYSTIR